MKSLVRTFAAALLAAVLASFPAIVSASSLESEIELLRSDLKAGKVEVVKEALHVEGAKADAFWPVYRKYQLDLDKIGDKRIAMIKDYAANYETMTDVKAKALVNQALDLQSQRRGLLVLHGDSSWFVFYSCPIRKPRAMTLSCWPDNQLASRASCERTAPRFSSLRRLLDGSR